MFFFLISSFSALAVSAQSSPEHGLHVPPQVPMETANDFKFLLERSTAARWRLRTNQQPLVTGILLRIGSDPAFTTKEAFRVQSNGTSQLVITSSSVDGLIFGFYKQLRQLGYRFYLPDELYTIPPKLVHPFGNRRNIVDRPRLQIRDFFGTGGFASAMTDPDKTVERDWNRWRLRNGFGAAYQLAGHRGENFILENRALLQKNPSWLATPLNGSSNDEGAKLNYQNPQAVETYVNWTLQPWTQRGFVPPPANHTEFLSIEPSDGGGFMNDLPQYVSLKLPSVSDQVFGAANEAAKKLDRFFPQHPNLGVNLYAYSSHAAPPSFALHPRVFVQLIPYQFQNIAFGPSFIKLWAKKAKRFGLYDYLNYPDAQLDLPGGLTLKEAMMRLRHSVSAGSEGTTYETSYSKFATGIPLWMLGRFMADGDANWETNMQRLTEDLYEGAAPIMRQLFEAFYTEPTFEASELGTAAGLLSQALRLKTSLPVQNRLNELSHYLAYVNLVLQSRDTKKGTLAERMLPVARYAWQLLPSKIVNSYRIMQLVSYQFLNSDRSAKNYPEYYNLHIAWFPDTERKKAAWGTISQLDATTTSNPVLGSVAPASRAAVSKKFSFRAAMPALAQHLTPQRKLVVGGGSAVRGYFGIYADKPVKLHVRYRLEGPQPSLILNTADAEYSSDTAITLTARAGEFQLSLPPGESTVFLNAGNNTTYRVEATLSTGLYFFSSSPRGKMAFYKSFTDPIDQYSYDPAYYPSYIFVPAGTTQIDYRVQVNALQIFSPSRQKISTDLLTTEAGGFEVRRFRVSSADTNKFWQAVISNNYNYSLLTIPDRYFLLQPKK